MADPNDPMVIVQPEELIFEFEVDKACCCKMKVINNREHVVAFKVKTTSPKKYTVRPNTGIVQPLGSCIIIVTLQPQKEAPPGMQCRDKFLLQSTKMPSGTVVGEVPPDTFNKDGDKVIEERKLRVLYMQVGSKDDPTQMSSKLAFFDSMAVLHNASVADVQALQRLKEDKDRISGQISSLQNQIEMIKKHGSRGVDAGFSFRFVAFVGLISLTLGFILNLVFSQPSTSK